MARLSREDWLEEGFKILKEFAQDKLRILYLCQRLQVTRGSFYHHFSSIENYVAALMQRWEKENTRQVIQLTDKKSTSGDRMNVLNELILQQDHAIEAAIRSWGFYHPLVKEYLDRVDQLRLDYLEEIFVEKGYGKKEASIMAELEYALLIGVQHRYPGKFGKRVRVLYTKYAQLVNDDLG